MNDSATSSGSSALLARLEQATNGHDLDAIVGCFTEGYRNETPAHPTRSFVGQQQVRRNWEQILKLTPDIRMHVLRSAVDGTTVWGEIEMSGTRLDGTEHLLRGVVIFGEEAGLAGWARFYMEPVEAASGGVDEAIQEHLASGTEP